LKEAGVPGFYKGGMHSGGLRIVGENGPELEATGPARIFNATETQQMLSTAAMYRDLPQVPQGLAMGTNAQLEQREPPELTVTFSNQGDEEEKALLREQNEQLREIIRELQAQRSVSEQQLKENRSHATRQVAATEQTAKQAEKERRRTEATKRD